MEPRDPDRPLWWHTAAAILFCPLCIRCTVLCLTRSAEEHGSVASAMMVTSGWLWAAFGCLLIIGLEIKHRIKNARSNKS